MVLCVKTLEHCQKTQVQNWVSTYNQRLCENSGLSFWLTQHMNHQAPESEFEDEEPQIKPLTPQEAAVWRKRQPKVSMWRILGFQALVGLLVALLAWWVVDRDAGWSAAYGTLAIVVPAALFARGVARNSGSAANAPGAIARLFAWEFVKLVLCIAMLAAAPFLVPNLHWLALLAGMVVTMKTYWLALVTGRASVRKTD